MLPQILKWFADDCFAETAAEICAAVSAAAPAPPECEAPFGFGLGANIIPYLVSKEGIIMQTVGTNICSILPPCLLISTININSHPASAITQPALVIVELMPALIKRFEKR